MLELDKDKIITRVINLEKLTEGQARAILEAPEEKRAEVARYISEHIEREGKLPSMREIKRLVAPSEAIEARRADAPSPAGFESAPAEKIFSAEKVPTEISTSVPKPEPIPPGFEPGPPKDTLLDRASKWYQTDLLDFVWERVTIPERRQRFLRVFSAVEHELIVEHDLLEEAWERAKTRFEKPEDITI